MNGSVSLPNRRTAGHYEVSADIACIGCGYNLRGLRANGVCPECGQDILPSIDHHRHPPDLVDPLRGWATLWIGAVVTSLLSVLTLPTCFGFVVLLGFGCIALSRAAVLMMLHQRRLADADLGSPALTRAWWVTMGIDVGLALLIAVIAIILPYTSFRVGVSFSLMLIPWWLTLLTSAFMVAMIAARSEPTLGYVLIGWIGKVQVITVPLTGLMLLVSMVSGFLELSPEITIGLFLLFGLLLAGPPALTVAYLANAHHWTIDPSEPVMTPTIHPNVPQTRGHSAGDDAPLPLD